MTEIKRLIEALEIRKKQLTGVAEGKKLLYPIHEGHHYRDVITTLSVLKNDKNVLSLLETMPTEQDLPK